MAGRSLSAGTSTGGNNLTKITCALNTINTRHLLTKTLALYGITGEQAGPVVTRSAL
jgi:hypothetical protein